MRPRIAITSGDPTGIGPEVLVRALAALEDEPFEPVVYGPDEALVSAAELTGLPAPHTHDCGGEFPEVEALERAVAACLAGDCAALVTAPIHKRRLMDGGFGFVGHTEFLAARCDADVVMAFGGGTLRVALLTTHLPLADVPAAIGAGDVVRVARIFRDGLRRFFALEQPRLVLCGLNPHAGEEGRLGHEDREVLAPGVKAARAAGIDLVGPLPADTTFAWAARGAYDGVIACYHDQGLTAVKAVDFGRSVNITMGLPFLRTSPDHGTAPDIAWTGRADPSSMIAAIRMAIGECRDEG
jgi:4-hydroxythreonine-4-phosphate dehydrogenase